MAVKILDNDNVMFIGKDKDVLLSLNSEQRDLLMKVVNETTAHYKSHWAGSQFLSKQYITKYENTSAMIDHVKFSGPATIMFWKDGTKTIVKCTEEDDPNCETGIAMATLKKILGCIVGFLGIIVVFGGGSSLLAGEPITFAGEGARVQANNGDVPFITPVKTEYTVGEFYTKDNKSLKNV